jgi:hypothetical protein
MLLAGISRQLCFAVHSFINLPLQGSLDSEPLVFSLTCRIYSLFPDYAPYNTTAIGLALWFFRAS